MNRMNVGFAALFLVSLISCITPPPLANIEPRVFEDDNVRIEFAIGAKVFNISVYNKTNGEIKLTNRSSIISVGNQTKNLFPNAEDLYIPPNSWVLFNSAQDAFFNENMYTRFTSTVVSGKKKPVDIPTENKNLIKANIGNTIRIYLSLIIDAGERVYDIPIKINGIMSTDEIKNLTK